MATDFVTVAQLRAEMADILARLSPERGPVYVTQRGRPRAVLLDVAEYRELVERLEYLDDSLEVLLSRERNEPTRPLSEVLEDLRAGPGKRTSRRARGRVSR